MITDTHTNRLLNDVVKVRCCNGIGETCSHTLAIVGMNAHEKKILIERLSRLHLVEWDLN